jgi:hypothetical protein
MQNPGMPQVTMCKCPCCSENLIAMVGMGSDMAMRVHFGVRFQWTECPTCGYDLTAFRFHTPVIQGQAQVKDKRSGRIIKP